MLRDGPKAREAKSLLGRSFRAAWDDKIARDGYTDGSGADPSSPKARMAATMQHYVDHVEQVPVIVLVCLVRYRKPDPSEGASVFPACQNLLLAARALGYGGALTGMHAGVEPELRALLGIPDDVADLGVHHPRPSGRPPRTGAAQAAGRGGLRRRVGRLAGVGGRPARAPATRSGRRSTPARSPPRRPDTSSPAPPTAGRRRRAVSSVGARGRAIRSRCSG